jgi:hypothetical protein
VPNESHPGLFKFSGKKEGKGKTGKGASCEKFQFAPCRISVQASLLLELVYSMLESMSSTPEQANVEKWYTARDMLELYRSVYIAHHTEPLLSCASRVMITQNDCLYLAHHLGTIGYQYSKRLPEQMRQVATFLDLIPFFRSLGMSLLFDFLDEQAIALKQACQEGPVEHGLVRAMAQLDRLARAWKPVAQTDFYFGAMGQLVQVLLDVCQEPLSQTAHLSSLFKRLEPLFEIESGYGEEKQLFRVTHTHFISRLRFNNMFLIGMYS